MSQKFVLVVALFVLVLAVVFSTLALLVYIHETSDNNPEWIEPIIDRVLDIIKIIVGAVVGALSTAMAYAFADKKREENAISKS